MADDRLKLTKRERQLVAGLARGDTSKAIAKKLGLSPHTVRTYLHTLYRKLDVTQPGCRGRQVHWVP